MDNTLAEEDLERHAHCFLYAARDLNALALHRVAAQTFKWAVRERFNAVIPESAEIRARFVRLWLEQWGTGNKTQVYWAGPKAAPGIARRIYEFLLKYQVTQAYQTYDLQTPSGVIRGENAVVIWASERKRDLPLLLDLRMTKPRAGDIELPNYAMLAQWAAARMEVETPELGILHVPVLFGEPWKTGI